MKIDDDGIPLEDGSHATLLYRLHPMELLIDEQTPDGEPLGEMFLDLYEDDTFALLIRQSPLFYKINPLCP